MLCVLQSHCAAQGCHGIAEDPVNILVAATQLITYPGKQRCSTYSLQKLCSVNIDPARVDASPTLMWAACHVLAVPKVWYAIVEPCGLSLAYQRWQQQAQEMHPTWVAAACMRPAAATLVFMPSACFVGLGLSGPKQLGMDYGQGWGACVSCWQAAADFTVLVAGLCHPEVCPPACLHWCVAPCVSALLHACVLVCSPACRHVPVLLPVCLPACFLVYLQVAYPSFNPR
jgi:hypothetical protein